MNIAITFYRSFDNYEHGKSISLSNSERTILSIIHTKITLFPVNNSSKKLKKKERKGNKNQSVSTGKRDYSTVQGRFHQNFITYQTPRVIVLFFNCTSSLPQDHRVTRKRTIPTIHPEIIGRNSSQRKTAAVQVKVRPRTKIAADDSGKEKHRFAGTGEMVSDGNLVPRYRSEQKAARCSSVA